MQTDGTKPTGIAEQQGAEAHRQVRLGDLVAEATRLARPMWLLAVSATILGLASGAAVAHLLAQINQLIASPGRSPTDTLPWLVMLAVVAVGASSASSVANAIVGQRAVARLRRELTRYVLGAELRNVERISRQRLIAILTGDLDALSGITLSIAPLTVAAATTVACFSYLAWLAPITLLIVLGFMGFALCASHFARRAGIAELVRARNGNEVFLKQVDTILDGGKELRMSQARRTQLSGEVDATVDAMAKHHVGMRRYFTLADASTLGLFWLVVILVAGVDSLTASANTSIFVVTLLFVRGPLDELVSALPLFSRGELALRRIAEMKADLGTIEPTTGNTGKGHGIARTMNEFDEIRLEGVSFSYATETEGPTAVLEDIDFTIRHGETVYISGRNGAGKSTLLKLLAGLYRPDSGVVKVDGRPVSGEANADLRELASTVFYDFHLFDEPALPEGVDETEVERLIAKLGLAHKVIYSGGRLVTNGLSTGQRRRLALIQVYLDRRPLVLFDEFAAEQDPSFRHHFYTVVLPELKAMGRTVVAITHDEHYFDTADRRIEICADGQLREKGPRVEARPALAVCG